MEFTNIVYSNIRMKFFLVVFLCFMIFPLPSHAFFGGKIESFSTDQVMISHNGKVINTSKLYITKNAYRMDGLPIGGHGGITRNLSVFGFIKQNTQYIYNHDKKLFFESQIDEDDMLKKLKSYENVDSEKILSTEKVSGYKCVKKEVTTTTSIMGMKHTSTEILWVNDNFKFPLRIQMENGQVMEFRNINTGEPSKKLFRRPVGYKKVNSIMAVMGMDFAAMVGKKSGFSNKSRQSDSQTNINDIDVKEIVSELKQVLGENADPEQMEQLQQIMTQAMNTSRQINMDKGAASGLWKIIPKHPGDKIGTEMKSPNIYTVTMGSNASLKQVFTFYKQKLKKRGWNDGGMYMQDGMGTLIMVKGQERLIVASSDNSGMKGNYKLFYNLKLHVPDI